MADTHEERAAAYEAELRAKYKQSEIDEMGKKGEAFGPDSDGHYSYPIGDEEDLKNAIRAVGRGNADHDAIRKYIIGRAKALKLSSLIPDNWNSDGSLKESESSDQAFEWRRKRAEDLGSVERRYHVGQVELREDLDGSVHFTGYASTTNTPYDMGWYTEQIGRGAFKKTLAENPDVVLNLNHGAGGSGLPIARTKAGNLRLSEDRKGLRVEADLDPQDPDVQLLARKMTSGNLDGQMSFAFRAIRQVWNDDYTDREIQECDIHRGDVSVVTQGANPTTSSAIRSWGDVVMEMRSRVEEETRVGKTISKDTAAQIQAAIDALSKLLESGQPKNDEDKGSSEDDPAEGDEEESLALPPFDRRAERARLEARRYPNGRVA